MLIKIAFTPNFRNRLKIFKRFTKSGIATTKLPAAAANHAARLIVAGSTDRIAMQVTMPSIFSFRLSFRLRSTIGVPVTVSVTVPVAERSRSHSRSHSDIAKGNTTAKYPA